MMSKLRGIILFIGVFFSAGVNAGAPNFFYSNTLFTIDDFVLGRNCFSLPTSALGQSCNPAQLAKQKVTKLQGGVLATNSVSKVVDYAEALNNDDASSAIRLSLEEIDPVVSYAQIGAWFQKDNWSLSISPARISLITDIRNPSYPEVNLQAIYENELSGQVGFQVGSMPDFEFGVRARAVQSKYILESFDFLSTAITSGSLVVEESSTLYVEPGATYTFGGEKNIQASLTLTHLKLTEDGASTPVDPTVEFGVAIAPTLFKRKIQTSWHYTSRNDVDLSFFERLTSAGIFNWNKSLSVTYQLSIREHGLAIQTSIDSVVLGLGYKNTLVDFNEFQQDTVRQVVFQTGLQF